MSSSFRNYRGLPAIGAGASSGSLQKVHLQSFKFKMSTSGPVVLQVWFSPESGGELPCPCPLG